MTDDSNPSEEIILQEIAFVQIQDQECGAVGWRIYRRKSSFSAVSRILFDSLGEAIESFLEDKEDESEESNDPT